MCLCIYADSMYASMDLCRYVWVYLYMFMQVCTPICTYEGIDFPTLCTYAGMYDSMHIYSGMYAHVRYVGMYAYVYMIVYVHMYLCRYVHP